MEQIKLFRHKTPVQIRFKDVDMMGHVNNANFFSYAEDARLKYFTDVFGAGSGWSKQDGLILGRFEIDFRNPLFYGNTICVMTRCSKIGTKSFELSWQIIEDKTADKEPVIFASGKAVLVCYDYSISKTVEIPGEKRKIIEDYEGKILPV
jgi:acyl-CoA thioester hydrolase